MPAPSVTFRRLLLTLSAPVRGLGRRRAHDRLARAARAGDASAAARLLRSLSRDVAAGTGRLHARRARHPLPRVAVLARSRFTDDVRAIAAELRSDRILLVPREALKAMAAAVLPAGTSDVDYRQLAAADPEAFDRYRTLLRSVWRHLDPEGTVRLVLTANTGYWAEVELGGALEDEGVAFVALHKENLKSPGHAQRWAPVYRTDRAPFRGRAVLVQNDGERALQVEAGIAPADRVVTVGMARLDDFHAHRLRTAGERPAGDVLVAAFLPGAILPAPPTAPGHDPKLGVPLPDAERRPEHLIDACVALHRVAVAVARRAPERRVVLKTKGRDQDRRWTPVLLDAAAEDGGVPPNLHVVHGGDAAAMTREAGVVVGLNSTMLLEAVAAGRPAVSAALGEVTGPANAFLVDLAGAATVVDDEDDAVATVLRLAADPPPVQATLDPAAVAVLERWTGNGDGRATARTVEALHRILDGGAR